MIIFVKDFFFVGMSNNSVKKLTKKGLDMFSKE
jgi:hypothetical protein